MSKIRHGVLGMLLFCAAAAAEDLPTFELTFTDGKVSQTRLEVPAGKRFKIIVHNRGKTPIEFESLPLRKEKVLAPGATSFVVFNPISAGEYPFYDEFHMEGTKGAIIAK